MKTASLTKKIILHIGMHKTGTTAIQKAFDGQAADGVGYAELSHTIDSFAQATDADLAAGQDALQAQLREVVTASQKAVRMLVGASAAHRDVSQVFVESSSAPLSVQGKL